MAINLPYQKKFHIKPTKNHCNYNLLKKKKKKTNHHKPTDHTTTNYHHITTQQPKSAKNHHTNHNSTLSQSHQNQINDPLHPQPTMWPTNPTTTSRSMAIHTHSNPWHDPPPQPNQWPTAPPPLPKPIGRSEPYPNYHMLIKERREGQERVRILRWERVVRGTIERGTREGGGWMWEIK